MKSVCCSGRKSRRFCVPWVNPFPSSPPLPIATLDWMRFHPAPRGSSAGSREDEEAVLLVVGQRAPERVRDRARPEVRERHRERLGHEEGAPVDDEHEGQGDEVGRPDPCVEGEDEGESRACEEEEKVKRSSRPVEGREEKPDEGERRAEVRLKDDEEERNGDEHARSEEFPEVGGGRLAGGEQARDTENRGDLRQLRRLEADRAHVDPALHPGGRPCPRSDNEAESEEEDGDDKGGHGEPLDPPGADTGDECEDRERDREPHSLANPGPLGDRTRDVHRARREDHGDPGKGEHEGEGHEFRVPCPPAVPSHDRPPGPIRDASGRPTSPERRRGSARGGSGCCRLGSRTCAAGRSRLPSPRRAPPPPNPRGPPRRSPR